MSCMSMSTPTLLTIVVLLVRALGRDVRQRDAPRQSLVRAALVLAQRCEERRVVVRMRPYAARGTRLGIYEELVLLLGVELPDPARGESAILVFHGAAVGGGDPVAGGACGWAGGGDAAEGFDGGVWVWGWVWGGGCGGGVGGGCVGWMRWGSHCGRRENLGKAGGGSALRIYEFTRCRECSGGVMSQRGLDTPNSFYLWGAEVR